MSVSCILRTTEKLAQDFLNGVGKRLHEELVAQDRINRHTSYLSGERGVLMTTNLKGVYAACHISLLYFI